MKNPKPEEIRPYGIYVNPGQVQGFYANDLSITEHVVVDPKTESVRPATTEEIQRDQQMSKVRNPVRESFEKRFPTVAACDSYNEKMNIGPIKDWLSTFDNMELVSKEETVERERAAWEASQACTQLTVGPCHENPPFTQYKSFEEWKGEKTNSESSSGRTPDFGSEGGGSNPSLEAKAPEIDWEKMKTPYYRCYPIWITIEYHRQLMPILEAREAALMAKFEEKMARGK